MMELLHGNGHIPGAPEPWDMELSIDWQKKSILLRIAQAPGGIKEWDGLMVQMIGDQEAVFRTHGLPGPVAHWWHVFRTHAGGLFCIVFSVPDHMGHWGQCTVSFDKGGMVED